MAYRHHTEAAQPLEVDPSNPWPTLNLLGRCEVIATLQWAGFACYDNESTDALRRALADALACGDVEAWQIGAGMDFAAAARGAAMSAPSYSTHAAYLAACTDVRRSRSGSVACYRPPAKPYTWVCADCGAVLGDAVPFSLDGDSMICYGCSHRRAVAELRDASRPFVAYLSCDGASITDWPGGALMLVTRESESRTGWHRSTITHVRATDVHGREWHGKGAGRGMCITMRACRDGGQS